MSLSLAPALLLLSTSAAWAQSVPDLLPRLGVPDTRGLRFAADTAVVSATLTLLGGAMPNEGGVCYYGELALVEGRPTVALRRVAAARGRGKLASFEWAPGSGHGCTNAPDLVGAGHSHPYSTCESEQSALPESRADMDAALLAGDPHVVTRWTGGRGVSGSTVSPPVRSSAQTMTWPERSESSAASGMAAPGRTSAAQWRPNTC